MALRIERGVTPMPGRKEKEQHMKHKTLRTLLCVILTVCFCLSAIAPVSAAGLFSGDTGAASIFDEWIRSLKDRFIEKNPGTDEDPVTNETAAGNDFIRIFHLDCGRKYFTVAEIKGIIDQLAKNNYTHIELAFGNDGFRFLLDEKDASNKDITFYNDGKKDYTLSEINTAIHNANVEYCQYSDNKYELTQNEMDSIINYASGKGIGIIPLLNIPGHTNTLVNAMYAIGAPVSPFTSNNNSKGYPTQSFNVLTEGTAEFVIAFVKKYVDYFAEKECTYFNFGADECGYDNFSKEQYTALASMLTNIVSYIKANNMTPMMFNDGLRSTNSLADSLASNKGIAVCFWEMQKNYYTAEQLKSKGFTVINTHNKWYYVAGNGNSTSKNWSDWAYHYDYAQEGIDTYGCKSVDGGGTADKGCMLAYWCDDPTANYDSTERSRVYELIGRLANNNPDYFKAPVTPVAPTITVSANSLTVDSTATLSTSDGSLATWASSDEKVLEVVATKDVVVATKDVTAASVTVRAVGAGTATVTAKLSDGTTLTSETITVRNQGEVTDEERPISVTVGQTLTLAETISGQHDGTQENEFAKVVAASREVAGETTYTKKGLPIAGESAKYYISSNKNDSSPTIEITIEKDTDENYYLKNAKGQYIYPTYDYNNGYTVATSNTKKSVNISGDVNSGFIISCDFTYRYYTYQAYLTISNGNLLSNGSSTNLYLYEQKPTPAGYETVVTVTGKKVTTDPVEMIVGTVKYLITVTAEDLSSVTPLPIQLWQTNTTVEPDANYAGQRTSGYFGVRRPYYVNVKAENAYGENGVALADVLPDDMYRYENDGTYLIAEQTGKKKMELVIWSGRVHNNNNFQEFWSTDYSNSGDEFNYIRYFGGKWQVSKTRASGSWIPVTGEGSTISSYACKEQLAVYYMMRTEITKEVTTDVADWGYVSSEEKYAEQLRSGKYVMLDFAVKYQDGTRNPSTFPVEKTFLFHCNDGSSGVLDSGSYRQLNNFRAFDTSSDYEVYMVTVTMTEDAQSSTITNPESYKYNGQEKLIWAIDAETRANSELTDYTAITSGDTTYSFDETRCIGGDPYVRGVEVYNEHGALITYYVRAKKLPDQTITVHYIDKNTGDEFYSYDIIVANGTTFNPGFTLDNNKILQNNTVKNSLGVTQTINTELKDMLSVPARYRRWNYECVAANTKEPYTDAYIYYNFDNTVAFVMDFGLPMKFTPLQVNANLAGATISDATWTSTKYGDLKYDNTTKEITYTLHDTLDAVEKFTLYYTGTIDGKEASTVEYEVSIIPASNVYYEENFMKVVGVNQNWSETGTRPVVYQDTEVVGKEENVFGYDKGVQNNSNTLTHSMSNAYVATLELEAGKQAAHTKDTLQFTFTGTGFDLIAACAKNTGMLTVRVDGDKLPKSLIYYVDTYFHGDNIALTNDNTTIYQVPVVRNQELPYGTYTVTVRGTLWASSGAAVNAVETYALTRNNTKETLYRSLLDACGMEDIAVEDVEFIYMDENSILNGGIGIEGERAEISPIADTYSLNVANETAGVKKANVYVDAFRVYEPLGNTTYVSYMSKENGAVYQSLYDYVKGNLYEGEPDNAVLYVEYDTTLNTAQIGSYQDKGPQNEIYLAPGCGIAFSLSSMNPDMILQISAKIVSGDPVLMVGNNSNFALTSTEMYYDITLENCISSIGTQAYVVISNDGGGVLAISGLKIKGTSTAGSNAETQQAILKKFAKKSDTGFTPDVFTVSVPSTARVNRNFGFAIAASKDVSIVTIQMNGSNEVFELTPKNKKAVENGRASNYSYSKVYKVKESGTYTFTIKAYDVNGNSTEIVRTVTVQ